MPVPKGVVELVERFRRNLDVYKRDDYKETRLRVEFVDPFFEALGWDVRNVQGYAEQYKDVVHEDSIKIKGATKAPDYCFRIGGARKFFLEVKKPSLYVKGDVGPAYQLRRYAWSAKLPLSILTDFEELAVYDCRLRPNPNDKAGAGRVMYLTFEEYIPRWDEIRGIFSKKAVLQGSFDRYVQESRRKRGTAEVDAEFLKEIEGWRDAFARNIALRNPSLTVHELNFSVQRTIDRIIFLRMCEDRGIEGYGRLLALVNGPNIYSRLNQFYHKAHDKYNSGLFDFESDNLTPSLSLDDAVLKKILKGLYYPQSPYEFSVLPAEVLGQVYEQFLGKVIRLTPKHRAIVEEKPAVKKAGGVYYTPGYIVDYIVRETVGRLIDGKTPRQISKLRILDPACGSGSFLLGAYQCLLDYYLHWYEANDPEKYARKKHPVVYQGRGGDWRLTTSEKKRILLNNIYGVDIDRQAVEVTKLSLLLKVLEGETEETLGKQLSLWREPALPALDNNIKCGNSLIGPDFFASHLMPDEEEIRRVNPFDWKREFFDVMNERGFDAVIGNPPYIRIQTMKEWAPKEVEFYKRRYKAASRGNYDIYVVFVERALELLNDHGQMGYILPHKFFQAKYGEPLRDLIGTGKHLKKVVHFGDQQVFSGATTYTCLLFLDKKPQNVFHYVKASDLNAWRSSGEEVEGEILSQKVTGSEWNFVVGEGAELFERLNEMPVKLGDVAAKIFQGLVTGADQAFIMENVSETEFRSAATGQTYHLETELMHPLCKGSVNLKRYHISEITKSILFPYKLRDGKAQLLSVQELRVQFPNTWAYLNENRQKLEERERGNWKHDRWYAFARSQNLSEMEQVKILTPSIANHTSFTFDPIGCYYFVGSGGGGGGGYGVVLKTDYISLNYLYLLGLLNSRLLDWLMQLTGTPYRGGYFSYNRQYIEQLPIRTINFDDPQDVARHEKMVALVNQMLELHKKLASASIPADKILYQRQIEATDRQIDALVYELYDLTEDEIRIVEGG